MEKVLKKNMKTSDFNFELPEELIAQKPSDVRGDDKLLVMDRISGEIQHTKMENLLDFIDDNTVMVFNNSKVRRARCFATKKDTGREQEFMFLTQLSPDLTTWHVMVKGAKKVKADNCYKFQDGSEGTILQVGKDEGTEFRTIKFISALDDAWFERNGHIPLPPYIKRADNASDSERYQNVYATELGSSACPTAGLHFTEKMLDSLKERGVQTEFVTLHVGLGTFLPVRTENIEDHNMHEEIFTIEKETAERITEAKRNGKKILAVGTTSVRTLESAWDTEKNCLKSGTYSTRIFIYPGYKFKVVDQLFTNFHTPESTLMMLVSAFSSREKVMNAYKQAVEKHYRFFSYGDACFFR